MPFKNQPTAQALLPDVAATPNSRPGGLELATWVHLVPFQWCIREPTAHALLADVAATPSSNPSPGLGFVTCFHLVPFQCRMRVEVRTPS